MKAKDFYEEIRIVTDGRGKVIRVLLRHGIPVNRFGDGRVEIEYKGEKYNLGKGVKIRRFPRGRIKERKG